MSHSFHKMHMTLKPHLFYSFMIHTLVLAYLLSIPVYIGSEFSINFGSYTVDLVSEERPAEKPARRYEAPKTRALTFEKSVPQAKSEVKSTLIAPPEPEVIEEEKVDETAETPSGITLTEEKPKETLFAKSEDEIEKQREETVKESNESVTKREEKPEPGNFEPVREEAPPAKPQPEIIKKENLHVQEAKAVNVADEKPSKVDKTDEQFREQFPVKPDEKAAEVSPLTEKEKTLLPKKSASETAEKESPQIKEAEKPISSESISETKEEGDKTTGAGEGKTESIKGNVKDTSKSLSQKDADTKRSATEQKARNGKSKKRVGDSIKKGKEKGPAVSLPLLGESFRGAGGLLGTFAGNSTQTPGGSQGQLQGDSSQAGGGKDETAQATGSGTKLARELTEKRPAMGIVIPLLSDIKVEVFLHGTDGRTFSSQLFRRTHPTDEEGGSSNGQEIRLYRESDDKGKAIFYVAKAENGIYTFIIRNNSEISQKTSLVMHLLQGKKGARNRKFETIELSPNAELKIKFILPEAVFWDDDSYFTGVIESSDSISKFNDMTGIIWKEEKE